MKIALDHDETYTEDPELWQLFIAAAQHRGHEVLFVTFRYEPDEGVSNTNDDIKDVAKLNGIEVVFTNGLQKAGVVKDVDIWIDDFPETIPKAKDLLSMYNGCKITGDSLW